MMFKQLDLVKDKLLKRKVLDKEKKELYSLQCPHPWEWLDELLKQESIGPHSLIYHKKKASDKSYYW